ncbi:DENN domain-containing protein 1B isoform X1 [Tachysurus vachellii]|uniref:DENN domain-containing protein 1B isoform X1 n=1 Tax=Tachysurus vachellii TaxID=175792 RepID=UPI00296ADEA5|nr:DENN domain-containing protein 1B isoform X1 [Tachysurus vachellii]
MDSRIRENPERTFDLVLQIACPSSENEDPTVLWKFPQDFGDQEVLQTVPRFCFPFDVERVSQNQVGQNFTFVLTDIESKQRFGFCRLTSGCKVCICLLSYLPWFENYYKLLNTLADYLSKHQENDLNDLLEKLYRLKVPKPDTAVTLSVHLHFVAPDITGLPTIPENRNLTEYFVAVDVNNMLHLYASMLHERRIIITSSKLSTLTACVHGSASMLYPMHWQHIYIPVLPSHLLDYCCAPMPYLIGVHLSLLERVKSRSLEDVIILNVDTNTLESPTDDLHNLPSDVVSSLKSKLKKQSTATGSGVARAFLRSQAALFGSYRDALRYKPGEPITFSEESFVAHRSSAMKSFLEMAVNLQLFKQFIDGRLAKLNEGRGFTDVFEEEITEGGFCGSNSRSYQQWMHTVKRGVNKASPAVKSAYKIAKVHAKKGLRGVKDKMKLKDTEEEEGGLYCTGSPTSTKSLSPRRLQKRRVSYQHQNYHTYISFPDYPIDMEDELDTASKISSEDSEEVPFYMEDSDDSCEFEHDAGQTGEMNLLEEILDSLSTTTLDHGSKLSSAKSLDFFRSMDELDCCTTSLSMTSPVQTGEVGTATSGDQSGWNMGQDDSAINGKHLPPSPRRQCSTRSLPDSTKPSETISDMRNSLMVPPTQPLACKLGTNASPSVYLELPSDLKLSPESQVTEGSSGLRRKVLSKETLRHYQERSQQGGSNRQPSLLIPWEIENKGNREEGEAKVQEKGLLEEIECRLSAALNSNL